MDNYELTSMVLNERIRSGIKVSNSMRNLNIYKNKLRQMERKGLISFEKYMQKLKSLKKNEELLKKAAKKAAKKAPTTNMWRRFDAIHGIP